MSSNADRLPPFTPEFAKAVCEAYQAVSELCKLAGAQHVVTFSGDHVNIGDGYNGRQIALYVNDDLINFAYGDADAK